MNNIATREAYGQVLVELGDLRDDIVVLDADLSKSTKTCEFAKKFPKRFFNMGIADRGCLWFIYNWKNTFCKYFCCICNRESF